VVVAAGDSIVTHTGHGDDRETNKELAPERPRVDRDLVDRIEKVSGVRTAIADVSASTALEYDGHSVGDDVQLHGWSSAALTPYQIRDGDAPTGAQDIVVGSALARSGKLHVGDHVTLGSFGDFRISGVAATTARVTREQPVFGTDATATRLAGQKSLVDLIGVLPDRGVSTETLVAALRADDIDAGSPSILTGTARGDAEFPDDLVAKDMLSSVGGAAGGTSTYVAIFVVAAALGIAVQQRSREIALLRTVAATPWQIRRMLAGEGMVIAVVGTLLGWLPGLALAGWLRRSFEHRGMVPDVLHLHVGWLPGVVSFGAAVVVVQLASFLTGFRATRIKPTVALQDAAAPPRRIGIVRLVLGLGAVAGGVLLARLSTHQTSDDAASLALLGAMVFMTAFGLLGPLLVWLFAPLVGGPARLLAPVGGFLAAINTTVRSRRYASAVTPIALSVSLAFLAVFVNSTVDHAQRKEIRHVATAEWVAQGGAGGLPESAVDEISGVSGVESAVGTLPTQVLTSSDLTSFPAQLVTSARLDRVVDLDVRSGTLHRLEPGELALGTDLAKVLHTHVGDETTVLLGDGAPYTGRVVATYQRSLGLGSALIPWAAGASHVSSARVPTILIKDAAGTAASTAGDHVRAVLEAYPTAQLMKRSDYRAALDKDAKDNAWVNVILVGIIAGFAGIAMVNTLVVTVIERRREFGLLRMIGATGRQIVGMARWEAIVVTVLGLAAGTAIGMTALALFSRALGSGMTPYVPPLGYAVLAGSAAVLALGATILPTALMVRRNEMVADRE
jgi:putative ABC transport system permease protein